MAYQPPAFYYTHGARDAILVTATPAASASTSLYSIYDSRQGELFTSSLDFNGDPSQFITITRPDTPAMDALDTIIISGHNWHDAGITVFGQPGNVVLNGGPNPVTEENGVPIFEPFTPSPVSTHADIQLRLTEGTASMATVPECTEIFFTTKQEMSRGPEPGWDHPWRRTQRQFLSEGGVSSTWVTGAARKTFRMTWRYLFGPDRDILLNMRAATDQWSEPFWFLPPDTIYPPLLMELDRDSNWQQDFDDPLTTGTADAVTMPMIEVLG